MTRSGRGSIWVAIGAFVIAFAIAPVLLSHDVYSYVDYARLGAVHGLDPYVHPPAAAPFDPAYARVTWIDATSAYGPLFTLATYLLAWLPVWWAVAALKATAALSVFAIALLVARIAPSRGVSPLGAAAFVALNPLVLIHVVGGAHNDGLAMLAAMLGVTATLSATEATAGAAFVAAFALKPPAALAAPFALVGAARLEPFTPYRGDKSPIGPARGPAARLLAGAMTAVIAIGVAVYAAFGWHWLDAIGLAGENQHRTAHMSVPITFARLTGLAPTAVRAAALALFAASFLYLLLRTWRGADWLRCAAWASIALLLATAWLLPWYLLWALPLVALSRDRPLQLLTLALTAYQLPARMPL
ncbi:MAG TPA: polyprenol phosphomannose-dependent alpha 1,6 mannosyltransferase MptB [Solirubrobacterales bacterium]|nr:polyprenol phosphomannose-dependent alpha 1,6 mannosyltransferase MptB [Solirubrobacterales bacterium]